MIYGSPGPGLPSRGVSWGNDASSLETLKWGFSQRCPSLLQLKAGHTIQALPLSASVSRI